jgi:hypothetical protein
MTTGVSVADGLADALVGAIGDADALAEALGDADALAEALGDSGVAVLPLPLPLPPAFESRFAAAAIRIGGVFNSSITPGTVVAPTTPETGSP